MPVDFLPAELSKGANIGLRDLDAELGSVTVVLETAGRDGAALDADVSVLLLGADERVRTNADMIFYNQPSALDGAIRLRDKVRTEVDDQDVVLDTITVDLDDVPNDVVRIVLLASLDPTLEMSFGEAERVRMRVQRASDGEDLASYAVDDASEETALLFGEFYRRDGQWRLRAIGQGYRDGLAKLATDFGMELDSASAHDEEEPSSATRIRERPQESAAESEEQNSAVPRSRLSVKRPARAPKMPASWDRTIPADDEGDWKVARLFPVAGIGGAEEQEQRATSALLAVATIVKEFGRALVAAMGGPSGIIEAFTEVRFGQDEKTVRPDGVIRSVWGQRTWTALIEVKTAAKLETSQIDSYVDVARSKDYDAVVMISNELTVSPDDFPVEIDRRKLKKVSLRHLGWDEIRAIATLCLDHRGVADSTQQRILSELLRYMDHPRSGTHGFADMGQHWARVRDSAREQTLRPGDRGSLEVINRYDQLVRSVSLSLSSLLGVDSQTSQPNGSDTPSRCQQFADSGKLFGSIRVPGAVDAIVVGTDVRTDRVSCSTTVPAPREGRLTTRINWLLRQLEAAPDQLRVEALLVGTRNKSTAEPLKTVRADPQTLVPKDNRDIRAFRLTLEIPLNTRRKAGRANITGSVQVAVYRFYAEVLQHLQRWTPSRPPRVPS